MDISFKDKNVLFITTKNLDYLRNTQEIELIKSEASRLDIIGLESENYLCRLLYVNWKMLSIKDLDTYNCVFIGFLPQFIVPIWWKKLRKNFLIIDFFVSVYDTMIFERKRFKKNGLMAEFCKKIDLKTIAKADLVICDTNEHGKYFSKEFGYPENRIKTLYLKADANIYYPMKGKRSEKTKDKFIVLYFGSILPLQGIDVILNAVELLKENSDIFFYIIGPIKKWHRKPKGENIEYIRWLKQEELAKKIAEADLCLAGHFTSKINKAKRTIPGKAYIYRAMNKPMILGDNKATRELYDENMDGIYFVEMGSSEKLAETILTCKRSFGFKEE